MGTRWTRVARGLAAAAIATFVAAFSHAAAGGGAPGGVGLALAAAFAVMVCVLFTRRSPSLPLLSASVVLSQLAFHLLFAVGAGADAAAGAALGSAFGQTGHGGHGAEAGHAAPASLGSTAGSSLLSTGSPSSGWLSTGTVPDAVAGSGAHLHDSGWMWLAHAVAAVATILLLRRGEQVLRRLVELGRIRSSEVVAHITVRLSSALRALALVTTALSEVAADTATETALGRRARMLRRGAAAGAASDRLRDLGVVFRALRHRGPPRGLPAAYLSA
jgi:hypothetical protein